jgi:hypothetical protein
MSSTDKTGEKLLASIRKTRAAGASGEDSAAKPAGAQTAKPAATTTKRKTAPKSRAKAAAKPAPRKAAPAKVKAQQPVDPFQAGRRVWPD